MATTSQLRTWVTALLLAWGSVASAQGPLAQGWGVGVDASRLLGGHAVVQVERAQSSEWLWQVAAGPHVGTVNGQNPFWKGLKGDVLSGSVVSVGSLVFPAQDPKLGATWFLGLDLSRESCRLSRDIEDLHAAQAPGFGVVVQTREEARLLGRRTMGLGSARRVACARWHGRGARPVVLPHDGRGGQRDADGAAWRVGASLALVSTAHSSAVIPAMSSKMAKA